MLSIDGWKIWVDVGQFALTTVIAGYVAWSKHVQVSRDALAALSIRLDERMDLIDSRMGEGHARLAVVAETLRHVPGHDDMKRAHERIDKVTELTAEVCGRLSGIERQLALISQHLLDGSPRGR